MTKFTKIKYSLIVVVFISLMSISTVAINAATAPIVPVGEIEDKYSPSTYNDEDYYVLPPDTVFSGVVYGGGSGTTADTRYTRIHADGYFYDSGSTLTWSQEPSDNILQSETRSTAHKFFDDVSYPRAVRIDSSMTPEFLQTQRTILSLHDDYSTTFFSEGNFEPYTGYFNTSGPYFLDVEVSNSKVFGVAAFDSAFPEMGYVFGDPETKMTYPVIPNAPGLQQFAIFTNVSTLVTLTPHEWKFPTWFPSLESNTIFTEEFDQGDVWSKDETNDQLVQPDNEMFSMRLFNLSVEEGNYYRINAAFVMDEVKPGVPSASPMTSLLGTDFEVITGDLEDEGLVIRATETVEITLIMYSPGEAHGSYSIFYQEMPPSSITETRPLAFNEDLALEKEIYYTFTLSNPIVISVNATGSSSYGSFSYNVFVEGSEPGDWINKENQNFISGTWRYLPAGTYAVKITAFTSGEEIRFNSVPIRPHSTLALSVNEESKYAIELPLLKNRIYFLNVSTVDKINQTIDYDWEIISKYNELVYEDSDSITLGNRETNGVWNAAPGATNDSTILQYLITLEREAPILLIEPTNGYNISHQVTTFDGDLFVKVEDAPDQSYQSISFPSLSESFIGTGYGGVFIPESPISSTADFTINSEYTTDNRQVLGIPLNLNPYTIYNVTATLTGNFSAINSRNVSFQYPFRVMGGDRGNLNIYNPGSYNSGNNNLASWQSTLILTVSETSYLYFDLQRDTARNATLQVKITDIGATNMQFHLDQEYNETISDYEVKSTSLLVKEIKPSEMKKAAPGFEISLVFIALVISSIFASRKRRNR